MKTSNHLNLTIVCISFVLSRLNLAYAQSVDGFGHNTDGTLQSITCHQTKQPETSKEISIVDSTTFVNVAGNIGVAVSGGLGYGGLAFADFNNDHLLDIFVSVSDNPFTGTVETNKLLMNTSGFVFNDVSIERGIANYVGDNKGGVLLVDFDNDGDRDLFVVDFFGRDYYYKNVNGSFVDFTQQAGLEGQYPLPSGSGACAGDFDSDGLVDIYVCNANGNNCLYRNTGDNHFVDVASSAGVTGSGQWTMDAVFFDYDNDGDADLLISNWPSSPALYRNNHNGTFTNITQNANLLNGNDVGYLAIGDYDNDGWLDIYWGKIQTTNPNLLFHNNGNGTFTDVTTLANVADSGDCRSVSFADYDSDGYLDLLVSNSTNQARPNRLYNNNGNGTFSDLAVAAGVASTTNIGKAAWGDYDNDGDLDVFMNKSDSCILYQNQGNPNRWFELSLIGTESNTDAIGARVLLYAGNHFASQYVYGGFGTTQHSPILFFGLNHNVRVDSLRVLWPSGVIDSFTNISANQLLTVYEDSTTTIAGESNHDLPNIISLGQNYPNPFNPSTTINFRIPRSSDVTMKVYDVLGKEVVTLVDGNEEPGYKSVQWNAANVSSGVYYYRLIAGEFTQTKKLILMK